MQLMFHNHRSMNEVSAYLRNVVPLIQSLVVAPGLVSIAECHRQPRPAHPSGGSAQSCGAGKRRDSLVYLLVHFYETSLFCSSLAVALLGSGHSIASLGPSIASRFRSRLVVCRECFLVRVPDALAPQEKIRRRPYRCRVASLVVRRLGTQSAAGAHSNIGGLCLARRFV